MDWQSILIAWGPAVPMLLFLLKVHRDVVYKIIPAENKTTRKLIRHQTRLAASRHREFMRTLKVITDFLEAHFRPEGRKKSFQIGPSRRPDGPKRVKTRPKKAHAKTRGKLHTDQF